MASVGVLLLLLTLTSLVLKCYSTSPNNLKTYIVYTGHNMKDETSSLFIYQKMLQEVAESNSTTKSVLHHYKRNFNGFVAKLTDKEADRMAGLDGVVSVFPEEKHKILTTKSWDFIGFPQHVETEQSESDIIIGVIDSGIWPESPSFDDKGFSPPPSKWKGYCPTFNFKCNNKLIGARYYMIDEALNDTDLVLSPRDSTGHGTHVASIAAGNPVSHASMLGLGQGTTRGGASSARIAVYKACWSSVCGTTNILAAFDDAIADGVDIISLSIAGIRDQHDHFRDVLSIAAFHAMQNGVLTVLAAGNKGPKHASLQNVSPWSIVVAAGTINRKFVTRVKLGNNITYEGISLNTFDLLGKMYPIVYGGDVPNKEAGFKRRQSRFCPTNSLDEKLVKGKIVLCEGNIGGPEAFRAGAIGVLTQGHTFTDTAQSFPLPACYLLSKDAARIHKYIHSSSTPTATIFKTEELEDTLAPMVASFSSRGPNNVTFNILKPDLIAPGVEIIASWSPNSPASEVDGDNRKLEFNILSGTSMACPHVSGAAGYIKSYHPTWSPAAIRSALMTTAKPMSPINNPDAEFAYGAGQIDPIKAVNPGLIYDVSEIDYIRFLCGQGFNATILRRIIGYETNCYETTTVGGLNYPSFAYKAPRPKHYLSGSFYRTVTNVGLPMSTYKAIVTAPKGVNIYVEPDVLSFTSLGEKQTYVLTLDGAMKESIGSGSLIWDDGTHQVRSPIIIFDERAEKGTGAKIYCINYIYIVIFNLLFYIIFK